jgi:hypothetical protein
MHSNALKLTGSLLNTFRSTQVREAKESIFESCQRINGEVTPWAPIDRISAAELVLFTATGALHPKFAAIGEGSQEPSGWRGAVWQELVSFAVQQPDARPEVRWLENTPFDWPFNPLLPPSPTSPITTTPTIHVVCLRVLSAVNLSLSDTTWFCTASPGVAMVGLALLCQQVHTELCSIGTVGESVSAFGWSDARGGDVPFDLLTAWDKEQGGGVCCPSPIHTAIHTP